MQNIQTSFPKDFEHLPSPYDQIHILSGSPEETALQPFPDMNEMQPQGPLRSLGELRAEFPNLMILPYMQSRLVKLNANQIRNIDLPDQTQFIIITSNVSITCSLGGTANIPASATDDVSNVFIVPNGDSKPIYCNSKQISIGDYLGLAPYVSVMCYVTDRFTKF